MVLEQIGCERERGLLSLVYLRVQRQNLVDMVTNGLYFTKGWVCAIELLCQYPAV